MELPFLKIGLFMLFPWLNALSLNRQPLVVACCSPVIHNPASVTNWLRQ
jgi:hypothetical protein